MMNKNIKDTVFKARISSVIIALIGVFGPGNVHSEDAQITSAAEAIAAIGPQTQVGPWEMSTWNIELPTINYLNMAEMAWRVGDPLKAPLLDHADIDMRTGLPTVMRGKSIDSNYIFGTKHPLSGLAGDWVMEVDGKADVRPGLARHRRSVGPGRYEWKRTAEGQYSIGSYVSFSSIRGPLNGLSVHLEKEEPRLAEGKLWSSRFVEEVSKYHIVRSMDLQRTNSTLIGRANQIPGADYVFWGNDRSIDAPVQSLPHSALIALAMETGADLWFQTPLHLGFPYGWKSSQVAEKQNNLRDIARNKADDILASEEWDRYAADFVAAMDEGGYETDRMIYISVGNEIWNYSYPFSTNTNYAKGLGEGRTGDRTGLRFRDGYGALLIRTIKAFNKAFAEAGRPDQQVVFVMESFVTDPYVTRHTLAAMEREAKAQGLDWSQIRQRIGVSVTSYWGGQTSFEAFAPQSVWEQRVADNDPSLAREFADWLINAPAEQILTAPWVLKKWQDHAEIAEKNGVFLLGAYEGGSHLKRPKWLDKTWYRTFLWGEEGARVNIAVNDALRAAFPNAILSNYAIAGGEGGSPWAEGEYGAQNPYALSWQRYQRP